MDDDEEATHFRAPLIPVPDPSLRTTEQIDRAVKARTDLAVAQLDTIRQRLDDMDKANEILSANVTRVPTDVDKQVGSLKELHGVRFAAVDKQFELLEKQTIREGAANALALAAALSAQKEAAAESKKASDLATDKSAKTTSDAIDKLAELVNVTINALTVKIDTSSASSNDKFASDSARMARIESSIQSIIDKQIGGGEQKDNSAKTTTLIFGAVAALIGVIGMILAVVAFTRGT